MTVNVNVFDVDGSGEGFQCGVIETMERAEQPQILRNPLSQSLGQRIIVNCQRYVVTQQIKSLKLVDVVNSIAIATAQCDHPNKFARDFQWSNTLKKFRSDIAIGTEIDVIDARIQNDWPACGLQSVEMSR